MIHEDDKSQLDHTTNYENISHAGSQFTHLNRTGIQGVEKLHFLKEHTNNISQIEEPIDCGNPIID